MKVSIIIRSYNSQNTIRRAIDSALHQNLPQKDFEIIVVDDGSKDSTADILRDYNNLRNVFIFRQQHGGFTAAANSGFRKSRGEYLTLLDADDYFHPLLIRDISSYLEEHQECDLVYSDYWEKVNNLKKKIIPKNIYETIVGGIIFRKKFLTKAGFFRSNVLFAEYDLFLRMCDNITVYHYKKPLYVYCRREKSISFDKKWFEKAINQLKFLHPNHHNEILKIRTYIIPVNHSSIRPPRNEILVSTKANVL